MCAKLLFLLAFVYYCNFTTAAKRRIKLYADDFYTPEPELYEPELYELEQYESELYEPEHLRPPPRPQRPRWSLGQPYVKIHGCSTSKRRNFPTSPLCLLQSIFPSTSE